MITYSNEDFDCAQVLAMSLTDKDRSAGKPAPAVGYSKENFQKAEKMLRNR